MKSEKIKIGKIVWLIIAALIPTLSLILGIALYSPHRDLYQRATVIITVGFLVGLIKWFSIHVSEYKDATKADVVIFILLTVYLVYVGYCQITLPICTECDKPTFLNAWIWKLLERK